MTSLARLYLAVVMLAVTAPPAWRWRCRGAGIKVCMASGLCPGGRIFFPFVDLPRFGGAFL